MVTADPGDAAEAVRSGQPVVLILSAGAPALTAPPGRLAILVGDPDDPTAWSAARVMERELFGPAEGGSAAGGSAPDE